MNLKHVAHEMYSLELFHSSLSLYVSSYEAVNRRVSYSLHWQRPCTHFRIQMQDPLLPYSSFLQRHWRKINTPKLKHFFNHSRRTTIQSSPLSELELLTVTRLTLNVMRLQQIVRLFLPILIHYMRQCCRTGRNVQHTKICWHELQLW